MAQFEQFQASLPLRREPVIPTHDLWTVISHHWQHWVSLSAHSIIWLQRVHVAIVKQLIEVQVEYKGELELLVVEMINSRLSGPFLKTLVGRDTQKTGLFHQSEKRTEKAQKYFQNENR